MNNGLFGTRVEWDKAGITDQFDADDGDVWSVSSVQLSKERRL